MMIDKLIEPDSLRVVPSGATVGLRLPWYRALPLSTVEVDAVRVDGELVDKANLTLTVGGDTIRMDELPRRTDRNWEVIETGTLTMEGLKIEPSSRHEVEVTLSLYPPYIQSLRRATRWSRTMEAK